jgi:hypothetical protein
MKARAGRDAARPGRRRRAPTRPYIGAWFTVLPSDNLNLRDHIVQ